jgi:amino acid transporter
MAIKRALLGRPLATHEEEHQRLRKRIALPVFASDAISSTAYATDEILVVLLGQAAIGAAAWRLLSPIALVVCVLLVIVVMSYRQTIHAYPSGGGSYIVSKDNLGTMPALVAGASLLVDYILTVAVSIAAGVLAITSAVPSVGHHRVLIALAMVVVMMLVNLRGLKESGAVFAPPTYLYIGALMLLIVVGLYRIYVQHLGPIDVEALVARGDLSPEALQLRDGTKSLGLLMLLRAFSSGAVALSGVEAVSNGVPAFRRPESRNAATTIAVMGGILGSCFLGLSIVAAHLRPYRGDLDPTGIALIAQHVYGGTGVLFWITQIATFAILVLAANTAYADFPRLASIMGRDGFVPRQFANRGDRLVFSNGIVFLSVVAGLLIVVFKGNVSALIPLYAFGVFTGFTLSQAGMVQHHRREREPGWQWKLPINALGAATTGVIAGVVVVSKFTEGAWIPAVVIPLLVAHFRMIKHHYSSLAAALRIDDDVVPQQTSNTMIVLVGGVHRGMIAGVEFAKSLRPDRLQAVHICGSDEEGDAFRARWLEREPDVPLDVRVDPYRNLRTAVLRYVEEVDARWTSDQITVVIPEFVVRRWWEHLLHNQAALFLKGALLFRERVVVVSVPYQVPRTARRAPRAERTAQAPAVTHEDAPAERPQPVALG